MRERGVWDRRLILREILRYGKRKLHIQPPVKIATPYGGRLVTTLYKIGKTSPFPSDMDSARGNQNHLPLEGQGQDQTQETVKVLQKDHNNKTF